MNEEKRSSKRISLTSPIRYQRKGTHRFGDTIARDLSDTGIGFISNEFMPVNSELFFEFPTPPINEIEMRLGEIVWISKEPHSERFHVGARFKNTSIY
ncbi:MAG: PilZ domain-containing protein [Candidatus Omnitrophota bacterium]